jgi:hypothetical protein
MSALAKLAEARRARYLLKPDLARHAFRAREAAHMAQHEVAEALDTQQPNVHRWEQGGEPHAPSVLHVASGPHEWAEVLVRWQAAQHHLQVSAEVAVVHGDDNAARLASVTVECGDPARVLAAALSDGRLTDDELEQLAREARECWAAAQELEAYASHELARRRAERSRAR